MLSVSNERQRAESVASLISTHLRDTGVPEASVSVRDDNSIGIRVASSSLFGTGRSRLNSSGRSLLSTVGAKAAGFSDYDIRVEGHTDSVPIGPGLKKIFKNNWELSVARAVSAVEFLSGSGVVDAARLSAVGFGEQNPISSNHSPRGREENRRVEVVLHLR